MENGWLRESIPACPAVLHRSLLLTLDIAADPFIVPGFNHTVCTSKCVTVGHIILEICTGWCAGRSKRQASPPPPLSLLSLRTVERLFLQALLPAL